MRVFGSTATGLVVEPATTFERMIHRGPPAGGATTKPSLCVCADEVIQ